MAEPQSGSAQPVSLSSSAHTDYGTTTLHAANAQNPTATADDEALRLRFSSAQQFGYQSLPTEPLKRARPTHNSFVLLQSSSRHHPKMTLDTMPNSETRQVIERVEYFLNVLNQFCIGFLAIYMTWLCCHNGLTGTSLHAWLSTIGYVLLMAEGIMCHYNCNVLTFNYKRPTKTTIHWVLLAVGGSMGVAGSVIKIVQKGLRLRSMHSKLGFASIIMCAVSMLSGLSALFSMRVKKLLNPLLNKTFHNLLGVATFVVSIVAQYYGYYTGFFLRKVDHDFATMVAVVTLVSMVLSCIGPLKAMFHKSHNIVRHFK